MRGFVPGRTSEQVFILQCLVILVTIVAQNAGDFIPKSNSVIGWDTSPADRTLSNLSSSTLYMRDSTEFDSDPMGLGPSMNAFNQDRVPLVRLTRDILSPHKYDVRVRPAQNHSKTLKIHISMSLYQIIEVNEPAQNIKMNVWMIQKWKDEMLDWDPRDYDMINTTILPHEVLWIPDTYLYNSVVMNADETERYMNIRADSLFWEGKQGSNMSFLYPAIYTVTCRLNIRYFPYDQQNCTLTISSWTNSKSALDYHADERVNMASYIANEEWDVVSFKIYRHEYKYACCPEPWVILEASIVLRRKPLYYVINLIIPTAIITLVAITGFFTPASTADDRTEKINLGITTLLAMSILMLMVSDQMPTTSEFVPLIAWFYLSIIIIISIGTFLTSVILSIQGRRQYGRLPPLGIRFVFFVKLVDWLCLSVPPQLYMLWEELNDHPYITYNEYIAKKEHQKYKKGNSALKRIPKSIPSNQHHIFDDSFLAPPSTLTLPRQSGGSVIQDSRQSSYKSAISPVSCAVSDNVVTIAEATEVSEPNRARCNWQKIGFAAAAAAQKDQHRLSVDFNQQTRPPNLKARRRSPSVVLPMIDLSPASAEAGGDYSPPSRQPPPLPPLQLAPSPAPSGYSQPTRPSRQGSIVQGAWENAIQVMGVGMSHRKSYDESGRPAAAGTGGLASQISADVVSMKRRRQCSLEWEFIATILDRIFLIAFTLTVVIVTAGMMVTGRVAQAHYEQLAREIG
ncbi:neurotransmitter-gated ion-channel ligand binding domain-containing protein [Ditylenchus destructor]|uniref:Neurotransmitter-gated ion-channel ligand binding domain-containing protein n=1 Tax=Ditylenchus destructor TaxID=166010 RepID=A0AAD4NI13_9BILA|nr:neurotransmitter-gated ion-channel ligand binding domain-containing protein [Ditylenchus destructor]